MVSILHLNTLKTRPWLTQGEKIYLPHQAISSSWIKTTYPNHLFQLWMSFLFSTVNDWKHSKNQLRPIPIVYTWLVKGLGELKVVSVTNLKSYMCMHSKNDPLLLIKYINLKSFWMRINLNFMNENIDKKIVIKITIGPICKVHRHTSKTNTHTPKDFIEFWKKK